MDRIKTHIIGFDALIEGGIPLGSNILITGEPGTGKTIFSMQYLYNGALNDNETGIYFTFEEKRESLIKQAKQFGWDFEKLEKKNKIKFISLGDINIGKSTIEDLFEIIKNTKAKRVVIDSVSTLAFLVSSENNQPITQYTIKKFIYMFITNLKKFDSLVTLLISQNDNSSSNITAKYISDGIIDIKYESLGGDFSRHLTIKKMRSTKNDEDLHPMAISKEGIIVHNLE